MTPARRLLTTAAVALSVLASGLTFTGAPALAAAPEAGTESVPSLTPFEARLEATVNAGEESTECHFQYGDASVSEHTIPCEQGTPAGTVEGGEQNVSAEAKGLKEDTAYRYRVLVKNKSGEAEGVEAEFLTLVLERPMVESENVSGVGSTAATLEAQVNPGYQKTKYTFEYATNKALTGAKTLKGIVEGSDVQTASGSTGTVLQAGEIYYYRVVAENETSEKEGKPVDGAVQSFTTVPMAFTDAATPSSGTAARLEGHFTLIPVDTRYSFEYNVGGGGCTGESSTPTVDAGTGTSSVTEAWEVPSAAEPALGWPSAPPLKPNTEYAVCFVTSNAYGSQAGSPVHFTTPTAPPTIDSESVTGVDATAATLEAKINPNVQETTYAFEYSATGSEGTPGTLEGMITTIDGEAALPAELAELPASVKTGVLQPRTTYYYRVVATDAADETSAGPVQSFSTLALPVVATGEAQSITRSTATFSGTVNPEGAETTYYFAYIDHAGYEKALAGDATEKANPYAEGETTAPVGAGASYEQQAVGPLLASGMLPETTYDYALVAINEVGVTAGPNQTFTTSARTPPIVGTGGVSGVSQNAATISGTVATNNLQTNYGFEIATEPGNYGPATGLGSIGGALTETVSLTLSELEPGTTYYYRVTATNADGTSEGSPGTFTTPGFPVLLIEPSELSQLASPVIAFPVEEKATAIVTAKVLSEAERLKRALKTCRREKSEAKRASCERQTRRKYSAVKKTKVRKKG